MKFKIKTLSFLSVLIYASCHIVSFYLQYSLNYVKETKTVMLIITVMIKDVITNPFFQ